MRTFLKTITGIIVIVILAIIVIGFIGWARVPDMVANNLSKKMGVTVQIGSINPGFASIDVKKFVIGNPPRSVLSKAFSAETIDFHAPIFRYLSQQIVVDEIDIDNIYLGLEFDTPTSTKGNWTTIMGNLQASTATPAKAPSTGPSRTLLIKKLVLTNISVDLVYTKDGGKVKKLPTIPRMELTNISSEGGVPMDQLMNSVLGQMLRQVFIEENVKNMLEDLLNSPANPFQQYTQPIFKGLFGK